MRDEATYKVNRKNNVCTAIISECALDALAEYYKQTQNNVALNRMDLFLMDNTFVGIAKCSPEDEFDERVGKNLAFQRAYEKYLKQKRRVMFDIADYVEKWADITRRYLKENKRYKNL